MPSTRPKQRPLPKFLRTFLTFWRYSTSHWLRESYAICAAVDQRPPTTEPLPNQATSVMIVPDQSNCEYPIINVHFYICHWTYVFLPQENWTELFPGSSHCYKEHYSTELHYFWTFRSRDFSARLVCLHGHTSFFKNVIWNYYWVFIAIYIMVCYIMHVLRHSWPVHRLRRRHTSTLLSSSSRTESTLSKEGVMSWYVWRPFSIFGTSLSVCKYW